MNLKLIVAVSAVIVLAAAGWVAAQPAADPIVEGFRMVEVASVSDAMEQLYGLRAYMYHDVRPVFTTKFAGRAVTVHVKKEEHKEGPAGTQGMLDVIDRSPAGSVYVLQMDDALDIGGIGGLMATAMKVRGFAGAVMDSSVRDLPQIKRIQFPVYSRGIVPATSIGHYRFVGANIPITCAGVQVNPGDIISADEDGVVVIPREKAGEILKKSQELDDTEHRMLPFIEKFRSLREAVAKFGRI